MKNSHRGFVGIILIILIAVTIIGGGAYFYTKSLNSNPER